MSNSALRVSRTTAYGMMVAAAAIVLVGLFLVDGSSLSPGWAYVVGVAVMIPLEAVVITLYRKGFYGGVSP